MAGENHEKTGSERLQQALSIVYYGHLTPGPKSEAKPAFINIYNHPKSTQVGSPNKEVYELKFRVATNEELEAEKNNTNPDRIYWAYLANENAKFTMVYPDKNLFNMSFTYGPKAEVEAGKGAIYRLILTSQEKYKNNI